MENLENFIFERNNKKDKLSYFYIKRKIKKGIKSFKGKLNNKIIKNNFISLVIGAALAFILIDIILIINFMNILKLI